MLDPGEWEWLEEHAQGDFDHLLIGTSLPFLLAPGAALPRVLERGGLQRRLGQARGRASGEKLRQARRPRALGGVRVLARARHGARAREVGGAHGTRAGVDRRAVGRRAPRVPRRGRRSRAGPSMRSAVYQATCSPFRNPLDDRERRTIRFACAARGTLVGRALARAAGVGPRRCAGGFTHDEPYFDNQVCFLELDGRRVAAVAAEDGPRRERGLLAGDGLRAPARLEQRGEALAPRRVRGRPAELALRLARSTAPRIVVIIATAASPGGQAAEPARDLPRRLGAPAAEASAGSQTRTGAGSSSVTL